MPILNNKVKKILDEREIKLVFDGNRRIVTDVLNDRSSPRVFNFLTTDRSWRVLLNAIVKSNWLDLSLIRKAFSELSKESGCSIVYEATCSCGAISDNPIIIKKISKTIFKKTITCKKCGEIKLNFSKYTPIFDVPENSILNVLRIGKKMRFLEYNISAYCFKCQETRPYEDKLNCEKCGEPRNITVGFYPTSLKLKALVKNQHGYWLEWYVYELLRKKFPTEYGLIYKENSSTTNIDVLCFKKDELWVIECKDSSDVSDFIKNVQTLKKIADKICLVSTKNIDEKSLDAIKHLLKDQFVYVSPPNVEKIPDVIAEGRV